MFVEQLKGHRAGPEIHMGYQKVQERGIWIVAGMQDLESSQKEKLNVKLAPPSLPHTCLGTH